MWLAMSLLALSRPAWAAPPVDSALSVTVDGLVICDAAAAGNASKGSSNLAFEVGPFMKLRAGDVLDVPADAKLRLVYFTGRRELWSGPARFRIGAESSSSLNGGPPEVEALGEDVGRAMHSLGVALQRAETEEPGTMVARGSDRVEVPSLDEAERAQVDAALAVYEQLAERSVAPDIVPEVYLTSVYLKYSMQKDASDTLDRALAKCPACEGPKALKSILADERVASPTWQRPPSEVNIRP